MKIPQVIPDEPEIYDGICPKHPARLNERMTEARFVELQRQRSQTEGRIAIFKNGFLDGRYAPKDLNIGSWR